MEDAPVIVTATEALDRGVPDTFNDGWESGVEHLASVPTSDLFRQLGVPDDHIPLFNQQMDANEIQDPWSKNWSECLNDRSRCMPLQLQRHQLEAVHKMVSDMVEGKGTLVMDGVGVGKTIEALALVALRAYYCNLQHPHLDRSRAAEINVQTGGEAVVPTAHLPGVFGKSSNSACSGCRWSLIT